MFVTTVTAQPLTQIENINYQVVHLIPGRMRLRIPKVAYDSKYASQLNELIESLDFVTSVRINPGASSLVVKYKYQDNAVALNTVQEQVFTAIQQASVADMPVLANSLPLFSGAGGAISEAGEVEGAISGAGEEIAPPAQNISAKVGCTPKEYALLVRGNYSLFNR
jgi:hypothetical protein